MRAAIFAVLLTLGPATYALAQETRPGPALDPAEVLSVVVYDDATGKPIDGAQVLYLHREDRTQAIEVFPAEWQRLAADLELRLERFGRSTTTDRQGIAFVPRSGLADDIAVRKGELYAQTWGKKLTELAELRAGLVVNHSVTVRVQDQAGKPCPDVEIWMQRGANFDQIGECYSVGRSAADGTRVVPRVRTFAGDKPLCLLLKLPGLEIKPIPLDPEAPPKDPVTFEIPSCVPLRMRITDAAGKPRSEPATVRVSAAGDPKWRGLELELRPDGRGEAVLPYVSAEHALRFEFREPVALPAVEVGPPAAVNVERVAVIALVAPGPVLIGRAVDEHARPLAYRRLEGRERHFNRSRVKEQGVIATRTDAEGHFRIYLGRTLEGAELTELWLHSESPGVAARVSPPRKLTALEVALGDLTFALEALVVAGKITGEGRLNSQPRLTVQAQCAGEWQDCELDNVIWLDMRSFEIRGQLGAASQLRLQTSLSWIRGGRPSRELATKPFKLGQKGLEIGD